MKTGINTCQCGHEFPWYKKEWNGNVSEVIALEDVKGMTGVNRLGLVACPNCRRVYKLND